MTEAEHHQDHHNPGAAARLLAWLLAGAAWLLASVPAGWCYPDNPGVAEAARAVGAVWLALPVLGMALRDAWRGRLSMNILVGVAALAALSAQEYQTAGLVAMFMLLSVVVETRTAAGAAASIEALVRMAPSVANRVSDAGAESPVAVADLAVGDCIRIRPGEIAPADGVIRAGRTTLNEAAVTGESMPADKGAGAAVFAGSHNLTGMIEVVVDRVGGATTLGRVHELIMAAERGKLPASRIIDVFVRYYIPVALMTALLVWLVTGEVDRVIAMLVLACPCALVLAAPAVMVAALAAAARRGVLLKNAADLETVARVNAFVFDKTGTLTRGEPRVMRLAPVPGVTPAELLNHAAAAESFSNHPLARALLRLCGETGAHPPPAREFCEIPGCGVTAMVDDAVTAVGQADWLRTARSVNLPPAADEADAAGWSILWVTHAGRCLGWIGFGDEPRPEAAACLLDLADLGVKRIAMVTGDRQAPAAAAARLIRCPEYRAQCLPQAKVEYVRQLHADGWRVAVVGDGINDAPALAAGDIGIAMGAAGSEVAVHSAAITLMNSNLDRLPFLVRLARRARVVVYQNIFAGAILIVGGVALAGLGLLHPVAAAIIHNFGSIFVALNSARLAGHAAPDNA